MTTQRLPGEIIVTVLRRLCLTASLIIAPALAAGQNRTDARIAVARARISSRDFATADTELGTALDTWQKADSDQRGKWTDAYTKALPNATVKDGKVSVPAKAASHPSTLSSSVG